jgi:hypothetical protein
MVGWLVDFEAARKQEDVMTRKFGGSFNRIAWLSALTLALPAMSLWPSHAQAQVIERGVQGGVVGAIIGGIVGGGRGVGTGAAIGAASVSSRVRRKLMPMPAPIMTASITERRPRPADPNSSTASRRR